MMNLQPQQCLQETEVELDIRIRLNGAAGDTHLFQEFFYSVRRNLTLAALVTASWSVFNSSGRFLG